MGENISSTTIKTKKNSRSEIFVQIFLPFIVIFILLITLSVFVVLTSPESQNVGHWANISLILLSIPTMIMFLLMIILLAAIIFGLAKLTGWLPIQIRKLYVLVLKGSAASWRATIKITEPVLTGMSRWHAFRQLFKIEFWRRKNAGE